MEIGIDTQEGRLCHLGGHPTRNYNSLDIVHQHAYELYKHFIRQFHILTRVSLSLCLILIAEVRVVITGRKIP